MLLALPSNIQRTIISIRCAPSVFKRDDKDIRFFYTCNTFSKKNRKKFHRHKVKERLFVFKAAANVVTLSLNLQEKTNHFSQGFVTDTGNVLPLKYLPPSIVKSFMYVAMSFGPIAASYPGKASANISVLTAPNASVLKR